MRYTLLGDSGLRVSELCLGTMTFGTDWGWGAAEDECRDQLELFIEAGGNFVDTADKYTDGAAERILGTLIGDRRERLVLATKYSLATRPGDPNGGGPGASTWSRHWRRRCGGSAPTTSTSSGCTPGTT